MREIGFEYQGRGYRVDVIDNNDPDGFTRVSLYGPDGDEIGWYGSYSRTDEEYIDEAIDELVG